MEVVQWAETVVGSERGRQPGKQLPKGQEGLCGTPQCGSLLLPQPPHCETLASFKIPVTSTGSELQPLPCTLHQSHVSLSDLSLRLARRPAFSNGKACRGSRSALPSPSGQLRTLLTAEMC